MSKVKHEQPEVGFEGEKGEAVEMESKGAQQEQEEVKAVAQLTVSIMSNGQLDVSIPEGMPELKPGEIENVTRQVYEQLRDIRIAQSALEMFKARLG